VGEQALVVVPRLVVSLTERAERPPTGPAVWGDTQIILPAAHAGRAYRNLYTGESVAVGERAGQPVLRMDEVLAHFPVALMVVEG
jgi:(1->4)-alpha-D-glucan 1-alpha-D-glucosylmutase